MILIYSLGPGVIPKAHIESGFGDIEIPIKILQREWCVHEDESILSEFSRICC